MIKAARLDKMAGEHLRVGDDMGLANDRRQAMQSPVPGHGVHPNVGLVRFVILAREKAPTISKWGEKRNWSIDAAFSSR